MVSEYANGRYGWVLSLMFAAWGVSTLALAVAIRAAATAPRFKVGVVLLVIAGVGEALASVFDLNHDTLHSLAGALGIPCLPLAALLISGSLGRTRAWSAARRLLRWTAHLTWVSVALWAASFPLMVATFQRALGHLPAAPPAVLPPGVIALVGWTNRLFILAYVVWVLTVAWQASTLRDAAGASPPRR
jgi:hypothetical protein